VRVLVAQGEKNTDEVDATLVLQQDRLVVRSPKLPQQREVEYRFITRATSSHSSRPKYLAAGAAAVVLGPLALPMLFMKSKKHWLVVQSGAQGIVLRLDKSNYREVIAAFERRSGRKVDVKK
jgi:hypothetical protein